MLWFIISILLVLLHAINYTVQTLSSSTPVWTKYVFFYSFSNFRTVRQRGSGHQQWTWSHKFQYFSGAKPSVIQLQLTGLCRVYSPKDNFEDFTNISWADPRIVQFLSVILINKIFYKSSCFSTCLFASISLLYQSLFYPPNEPHSFFYPPNAYNIKPQSLFYPPNAYNYQPHWSKQSISRFKWDNLLSRKIIKLIFWT